MQEFKVRPYKGEKITGILTLKIDGIRAHKIGDTWLSRTGKPLYHLPADLADGVYEIYSGAFDKTVTAVMTRTGAYEVHEDDIYMLSPCLDDRLYLRPLINEVCPDVLPDTEGYVIHGEGVMYKVKKQETVDVLVTAIQPGTGKYVGKMGALITDMGKVGTGFTDQQRLDFNDESVVGKTIEVGCMEITKDNKFRHPRFIRFRPDKDEVS